MEDQSPEVSYGNLSLTNLQLLLSYVIFMQMEITILLMLEAFRFVDDESL
jgi:hypothetical protein